MSGQVGTVDDPTDGALPKDYYRGVEIKKFEVHVVDTYTSFVYGAGHGRPAELITLPVAVTAANANQDLPAQSYGRKGT